MAQVCAVLVFAASCASKNPHDGAFAILEEHSDVLGLNLQSLYSVGVKHDGDRVRISSISKIPGEKQSISIDQAIFSESAPNVSVSLRVGQNANIPASDEFSVLLTDKLPGYAAAISSVLKDVFPAKYRPEISLITTPPGVKIDEAVESVLVDNRFMLTFFVAQTNSLEWEAKAMRTPLTAVHELHHVLVRLPETKAIYTAQSWDAVELNFILDEAAAEIFSRCVEFEWRGFAQVWARSWPRIGDRHGSATDLQIRNLLNPARYKDDKIIPFALGVELSVLLFNTLWLDYFGNVWEVAADDQAAQRFQREFCTADTIGNRETLRKAILERANDGTDAPQIYPEREEKM